VALYNDFVQPIYRYVYTRVGNKQDAEDLTSQTFLSALKALPRFKDKDHFPAWLFTIARNKVMDYFRSNKRELAIEIPTGMTGDPDIQDQVFRDLDLHRLSTLVAGLGEHEQELIRLRYVADLKFADIAALLGRKEDAVKKELYRLLARLKNQMEAHHE